MTAWQNCARDAWTAAGIASGTRTLAVETPVAIVVNAVTAAVMLATPDDLEDFAIGFALTERLIAATRDVAACEVVEQASGIEVRLWLTAGAGSAVTTRRRLAAPSGCGLCGIESLDEAVLAPPRVTADGPYPSPAELLAAMAELRAVQPLGTRTRATHAAALWRRGEPLFGREDVGRHNALDKLVGAAARGVVDPRAGVVVLTSRISVEMVQKTAMLGAPMLVAVSAPTTLAVATAAAAGLTLVAVARHDGFEVFTRPDRIAWRR